MNRDVFTALQAARQNARPAAVVTELATGRQALLVGGSQAAGSLRLEEDVLAEVLEALRLNRSGRLADPNDGLFIAVFNPPLRLIIVGAVHIAQVLAPMAALAGYDVTMIDPRRSWATETRFPGVAILDEWPDEALASLAPDPRTAIVTLTHDPKLDDPALAAAVRSPAFYVGALGSSRTHAKRLQRLASHGLEQPELDRIHGPIGLALGGRSPAEIAIAILAQMTQVLHAAPVTDRKAAE